MEKRFAEPTKLSRQNPNKTVEAISPKKTSSLINFYTLCGMGYWQTCRKKMMKCPKNICTVSQKKRSIKLFCSEKKTFFLKITSRKTECSFGKPVAIFPPNVHTFLAKPRWCLYQLNVCFNIQSSPKSFSEQVRCNFVNRGDKPSRSLTNW